MEMMTIALVRMTNSLTDAQMAAYAADQQVEITDNFARSWGNARILFIPGGSMIPGGAIQIHFEDFPPKDDADDLGFHDVDETGWPVGHVYVKDCITQGVNWTITGDHEVKETIADPSANKTIRVVHHTDGAYEYALEVCDPCEDDRFGHLTGTHHFSDHVLPSYYTLTAPGPYSFGNHIVSPLSGLPGGYVPRRKLPDGAWDQNLVPGRVTPRMVKGRGSRTVRRFGR